MAQTREVIETMRRETTLDFTVKVIRTHGDIYREGPLENAETTGLFTREIEENLLAGQIDLAVHSLKDLPLSLPPKLAIAAVPVREEPWDALVIARGNYQSSASGLPLSEGSVVGTGSLRRKMQLTTVRPDLKIRPLRGNIDTRLEKIIHGEYDAGVFACAGLNRLNFRDDRLVIHRLQWAPFIPAPGQGALAIEMRRDDPDFDQIKRTVNDLSAERCVAAERKLLEMFGGGCALPVGALVSREDGPEREVYTLRGFWGGDHPLRWETLVADDLRAGILALFERLKNR